MHYGCLYYVKCEFNIRLGVIIMLAIAYLMFRMLVLWIKCGFAWLNARNNVLQMSNTGWDTGVSLAVCQTRLDLIKDMAVFKCRKIWQEWTRANTRACPETVFRCMYLIVVTAEYTGVSRDRVFRHGRVSISNFKYMTVYNLCTVPLGETRVGTRPCIRPCRPSWTILIYFS